jgi:hypothetical protein
MAFLASSVYPTLKKHDVENAFLFLLDSLKSLGPVDSQNETPA